jgi:hypothetical protein
MSPQAIEGRASQGRVARRQNARARPGRLLPEIPPIDDLDPGALAGKKIGGGQTNDPATDDQDIWERFHSD